MREESNHYDQGNNNNGNNNQFNGGSQGNTQGSSYGGNGGSNGSSQDGGSSYGGSNNSSSNSYGGSTNKYNSNGGSGGGNWSNNDSYRIPIPEEPYFPFGIVFTGDKELSNEQENYLSEILLQMKGRGFTLRYQVGKLDERLIPTGMKTEKFLPFKDFDDIKGDDIALGSKFNMALIPKVHPKGEDLPKGQRSMLKATIAVLVGPFNTSASRFVLVVSPDGAQLPNECGKETGWVSPVIKIANQLGVVVANLNDRLKCSSTIEDATKYIN